MQILCFNRWIRFIHYVFILRSSFIAYATHKIQPFKIYVILGLIDKLFILILRYKILDFSVVWSVCNLSELKYKRTSDVYGPARRIAEKPFMILIGNYLNKIDISHIIHWVVFLIIVHKIHKLFWNEISQREPSALYWEMFLENFVDCWKQTL